MRPAPLLLLSILAACGTGTSATGSTGDDGVDDITGSTTIAELLPCGDAPSSIVVDGVCYCEPGTTWTDPFNPNSFDCEPLTTRVWPPCYVHGEGPGCTCGEPDPSPPAVGNCEPIGTASSDDMKSEETGDTSYTCKLDSFECDCEDPAEACECGQQVYTCTCPAFTRWCSFDPGPNVECCYDPSQDPTGEHAPATTTGEDATSTGADSTSTTDTSTTGSSSDGETGSGSSSAGSTGAN